MSAGMRIAGAPLIAAVVPVRPAPFAARPTRDGGSGGRMGIFYSGSVAIPAPHSGHTFFDARRS